MRNDQVLITLLLSLLVISPIALVEAQSPYPIYGAQVDVSGINGEGFAVTDSLGNFLITQGLVAGFYDVDVGLTGYISTSLNATVTHGVTTDMGDIYLNVSAKITGIVQTPSGSPAASIKVDLVASDNSTVAGSITLSDGTFTIDTDVPTGTYSIKTFVINGQPYAQAPVLSGVSAVQGQTTSVGILKLTQSGTISGKVANIQNMGVANVTVLAFGANGVGSAKTNSLGLYSISSNLATGSYNVSMVGSSPGYIINMDDEKTVSVTAGQTATADFTVENSGSISGTVTLANSNLASGISVSAFSSTGSFGSTTTKSDGTYIIDSDLDTGTYTVIADDYFMDSKTVSVIKGSLTTNIDFQLAYNLAWISGSVRNATAPLSSADLFGTYPPTHFSISAFTEEDGTYLMEIQVPSGEASVQIDMTASATGYADGFGAAIATVGQTTSNVDFTLQPVQGGSLKGRVVTNNPPQLLDAALTLSPSSSSIILGTQLTLSGTLAPAQADNVTIYQSINGSSWIILTPVALSGGSYSYAFSPSALGSYLFYAAWPGNAQYNPANSSTVQVTVSEFALQNATLSIQSSVPSVTAGSVFTVSGALTPARPGRVTIWESINGSTFATLISSNLTSGAYTFTLNRSIAGTYQFKASWPGDSLYNPADSSTISVSVMAVQPTTPTLVIVSSAANVNPGQSVTLSGTINPSAAGVVTISQSVNGSAYQQIANVTLSNGAYSYQYTIPGLGTYMFRASFAGNSELNPAQSTSVTVTSPQVVGPDYTWYFVGGMIAAIVLLALAYYTMVMKKKPTAPQHKK